MEIVARIPTDRIGEGEIRIDGSLLGRCRGKADNAKAQVNGNPHRSPVRPYGDHPGGRYRVTEVQKRQMPDRTFGPWRIVIQPIEGECVARENVEAGDDGIMIHGGDPAADGVSLRVTYGCLRVTNSVATELATRAKEAMGRGEEVLYTCELS